MDPAASAVFDRDNPRVKDFLIADILQTACRGLDVQSVTRDDQESFQNILTAGGVWPDVLQESARRSGVRLSAGVIRSALLQCLFEWDSLGKEMLIAWEALPDFVGPANDSVILPAVHGLARAAALFEYGGPAAAVCTPCLTLAEAFESSGRLDDAVAAALTATNLAESPDLLLHGCEVALRNASACGNTEAVSLALAGKAHALSQMPDTENQLRAFDAVTAALRHLPDNANNRLAVLSRLLGAVRQSPQLTIWRSIIKRIDAAERRSSVEGNETSSDDPDDLHDVLLALTSPSQETWPDTLFSGVPFELEREREKLLPNTSADAVITSWVTGSFDHYAYRNAIPHGSSLLRERDLDRILLLIGHELSHVISLQGHLGVASAALRVAAVELELVLWTFSESKPPASPPRFMAPLDTTELLALAQAEQALDVARKRQILQATWGPWFEGLAMFGELAVDPSADDTASDIGEVLINSVDESFNGDANTLLAWFDERRKESEQMYTRAQQREGPLRLRGYLDRHHVKYLAGYLAVRSIVSCWRHRMDRPLNGAAAYRVLLHRTRYDTRGAIPDLSLATAQFAAQAENAMLAWVDGLAATRSEDIDAFLETHSPAVWRNGRLVVLPVEEMGSNESEDANDWYMDCVCSAMRTNVGSFGHVIDRVAGADDSTRQLLKAIADGLTGREPRPYLADSLAELIFGQRHVLPLGRVSCPFWLEKVPGNVVCLIRTTEHGPEAGMSRYDLLYTRLDPESFKKLETEVQCLREPRMMIYRIVDLMPGRRHESRFGRQVIVFKYGEWSHIENRGVFTGAKPVPDTFVDDIQTRVFPPDVLDAEYELAAFAPAATRIIEWMNSVQAWTVDGDEWELPTDAWTQRVTALAHDVVCAAENDSQLESRVGRRLLGVGIRSWRFHQ